FASENLLRVLAGLHLSSTTSVETIQLKLLVMTLIFVYAFVKFTWSVREHIFSSILIGSARQPGDLARLDNGSLEGVALQVVMRLIFVYAVFTSTWSVGEHIFSSILIGSAPPASDLARLDNATLESVALQAAKMSDLANHDFNHGLRAYYFALALLGWLVNG